ncbi:MAG: TnsD family transposase [Sporomusaceae bacterium]|nr:TnsD family transposase [Sporomusaceae bacterium]
MLPFFPSPYPDEILFSICSRYHDWNHSPFFKRTLAGLIGENGGCATVGFPSHIGRLINFLPSGTTLTAEGLINQHTLFPLFRPFLPVNRGDMILRYMIGEQGRLLYQTVGAMASGIPMLRYLRYCQQCIREDINILGEAYWHRVHQVPGVGVCPTHYCKLSKSEICISPLSNKTIFYSVPTEVMRCSSVEPEVFAFPRTDIAKAVQWLLKGESPVVGLENIRQRYVDLLYKKDLATFRGRIRQKEVAEAFNRFFSADFVDETFSAIESNQTETWLSRLLQKPRTACHPIRHLLLMLFLGTTPEGFFSRSFEEPKSFGEAPWPCLNPVCEHYRKNVIHTCLISRDSKMGCPVGTFNCDCGFSYARSGPDSNVDSRYKIGRIKSFGGRWLQKLWEYIIVEKCSLREVARRLAVDPETVKNQLAIILGEKAKYEDCYKENQDKRRDNYRAKLLLTVRLNPDKCRTELRNIIPGVYIWLYRHDRFWLSTNLPPAIRGRGPIQSRINWDERDGRICIEVRSAAKLIKNKEPLVRVTISSLGKEAGCLSLLHKHLAKLPRTREVLETVAETIEEFQDRRIMFVIEQMIENRIKPVVWKIMRAAGRRKGAEGRVNKILKRYQDERPSEVVERIKNEEGYQ